MSKKQADEHLQDIRSKDHNKIRYQKRVQQELEEERYLKDELKHIDDADPFSEIP